jgi:aminopeptidase N/puromycin-sensitive aminopeptidase
VSGEVRNQDSRAVLAALLRDRETRDQSWDYIQKNWDKVHAQLTVSSGAEVVRATGSFCSVQQRDEVVNFFAAHRVEAAERTLAKAVDSINDCIQLRAAQEPDFHRWLEAQPR